MYPIDVIVVIYSNEEGHNAKKLMENCDIVFIIYIIRYTYTIIWRYITLGKKLINNYPSRFSLQNINMILTLCSVI